MSAGHLRHPERSEGPPAEIRGSFAHAQDDVHTLVHAISIPSRAFTGDFWFTHRTSDRLWFAIGDVAGKGLPAALVMAMIQEELEHRIASCARAGCNPATTMSRLHGFLRPLLPSNRFATAVIGWIRDDGCVKIVNAGHCPPLIVYRDGRIGAVSSTGPVVGILEMSEWNASSFMLADGEMLFLYTDGVTEAVSLDDVEFGREGIERVLRRSGTCCMRTVTSSIVDAVHMHANGERSDDLTVMAIATASGQPTADSRS